MSTRLRSVRGKAVAAGVIFLLGCGDRTRQEPVASPPADTGIAAVPAPAETAATPPAGPAPVADAPLTDAYHTAPRDTISREAYNGWKQFELNCARCHGEYAVGTSFAPALVVSLKEGGTIPTKEAFVTTVCQGRKEKGMPSWCELGLEMDKIMGIYAYVKGRADGKIHEGRPAVRENS